MGHGTGKSREPAGWKTRATIALLARPWRKPSAFINGGTCRMPFGETAAKQQIANLRYEDCALPKRCGVAVFERFAWRGCAAERGADSGGALSLPGPYKFGVDV